MDEHLETSVKVSIIMACYNSARYLAAAINSILLQTIPDWELIIVDDCSTDHSASIAKKYCELDSRISFIALQQNQGPAVARNAALNVAKGKWIAILDSDDIALPYRLEKQLRYAEKNPACVLIGSHADIINQDDNFIQNYQYPTTHKKLATTLSSHGAFPPHSSIFYRRDAILSLSGFNKHFLRSQDFDLFLRLSEVGELGSVDETLVQIREHDTNISYTQGGLLQYKFAVAALACHILRIRRHEDPSRMHCKEFLDYVDHHLQQRDAYHFYSTKARIKAEFQRASSKLQKLSVLIRNGLKSGFFLEFIKNKLFKSQIAYQLADGWIKELKA